MIELSAQKKIDDLEGLSEVIIETLKSLSIDRQPLTVSFLSDALGKRDEVQGLLASIRPQGSNGKTAEKGEGGNGSLDPQRPHERDLLLRQSVEEHEQVLRMTDFLRRSITTVAALMSKYETGAVSESLSGFKKAVLAGAEIGKLEECLENLKDSVSQSEEEEPKSSQATSLWDKLLKRKQPPDNRDAGAGFLKDLQAVFLNIIAEFDQDLGEDYSGQLARLRKDVEESVDLGHLSALKDDLLALLQTYNRTIQEEREQVTDFIAEIGNSLFELEHQFVKSVMQSEQNHTAATSFTGLLESHIEDLKKSAQITSTLAEFKSLVMSRLASIRAALEEKRKAEQERQAFLDMEVQDLQQNLSRVKKEIAQVQEKRKALEKEILIDQLTGIANRRAFKRRLKEELQRYQRYRHFFSILFFDIDHFKSINDEFGHWAGDKCLKELIKRVKPISRETDFIARWGGEEFVMVLPGTDLESAAGVAERLRKMIENTRFLYHKQEISLTVSIGVTEVVPADQTQEAIFNRVDKAMYDAKRKGRNLVVRA